MNKLVFPLTPTAKAGKAGAGFAGFWTKRVTGFTVRLPSLVRVLT